MPDRRVSSILLWTFLQVDFTKAFNTGIGQNEKAEQPQKVFTRGAVKSWATPK